MAREARYSLEQGTWIGGTPYRVVRPLGQGGMGEVYEVDHTRTGTRRALKILRTCVDQRGQAAQRLLCEARTLAAIDHPNVVRVYELGAIQDGRPYFAMQLLDGSTARELITRTGRVEAGLAVRLAVQAAHGLDAVHARGVIHRDIKPTNLFVCRNDRVKLLDFGVAKIVRGPAAGPSTAEGVVLGTMRYMAPEQLGCGTATPATDVYALGMVLFEMITGEHAFRRASGSDSVSHRLRAKPPRMSRPGLELPSLLDEVVAWALQPDPSQRPQTARAFACALSEASGVFPVEPRSRVHTPLKASSVEPSTRAQSVALPVPKVSEAPVEPGIDWRTVAKVGIAASLASLAIGATAAVGAVRLWMTSPQAEMPRQTAAACLAPTAR